MQEMKPRMMTPEDEPYVLTMIARHLGCPREDLVWAKSPRLPLWIRPDTGSTPRFVQVAGTVLTPDGVRLLVPALEALAKLREEKQEASQEPPVVHRMTVGEKRDIGRLLAEITGEAPAPAAPSAVDVARALDYARRLLASYDGESGALLSRALLAEHARAERLEAMLARHITGTLDTGATPEQIKGLAILLHSEAGEETVPRRAGAPSPTG